jgi:hypothetical protein
MKLRPQYCKKCGEAPGDYAFFAEAPGPEWIEVTDSELIRAWTRGFPRWILETWRHIRRVEEKRPRLIDWRATPAEMRAHIEKLQSEMRTDERPRLFRRPLTVEEEREES